MTDIADPNGWISWAGGERPVDGTQRVEYRLRRDGDRTRSFKAGMLDWAHTGGLGDIVAYRIVP
jgi:hypothetical protein